MSHHQIGARVIEIWSAILHPGHRTTLHQTCSRCGAEPGVRCFPKNYALNSPTPHQERQRHMTDPAMLATFSTRKILDTVIDELKDATVFTALKILRRGATDLEAALLADRAEFDAALGPIAGTKPKRTRVEVDANAAPKLTDPAAIDAAILAMLGAATKAHTTREIADAVNVSEANVKASINDPQRMGSTVRGDKSGRGKRWHLADRTVGA